MMRRVYRKEKRCQPVDAHEATTSATSGTSATEKLLSGRKNIPLKEGFEESIDFDPVGMFQPNRIQETLLDVSVNGTGRNSK